MVKTLLDDQALLERAIRLAPHLGELQTRGPGEDWSPLSEDAALAALFNPARELRRTPQVHQYRIVFFDRANAAIQRRGYGDPHPDLDPNALAATPWYYLLDGAIVHS